VTTAFDLPHGVADFLGAEFVARLQKYNVGPFFNIRTTISRICEAAISAKAVVVCRGLNEQLTSIFGENIVVGVDFADTTLLDKLAAWDLNAEGMKEMVAFADATKSDDLKREIIWVAAVHAYVRPLVELYRA